MKMGISTKVVVLISAMLFMNHKVSATSLSGSVSVSPLNGKKVVGGDEIVVNVNASLTSSDVLNDINLRLECINAKLNSTTDILALWSSTAVPTSSKVGNDEVKASLGSTSLLLGEVLEFSWITMWFIPDTVIPASSIACDYVMSYENSSSLVESQILYSGVLSVLAPNINLTNADGEVFDGSSRHFAEIGEEVLINIMAMVPQSNVELEVKIEPTNQSADIAAATGLAITEASSRVNCQLGLTGQKCRTKNQAVDPRGLSLKFYDDEVSIFGDISMVSDFELQAKIRVGDDGISDGEMIQVDVSMTTGRSHVWISAVPCNISDNGESRATVLEVNPMTTHSLYNEYNATMQVELRHASSSRASAKETELHLMTSPRTVYQGLADTTLLTQPPVIDGSFVIFKLGDLDLFSSIELLINLKVVHTYQGAGVSNAVNLVQAVYKNDTHSTARGSSSLTDVQFQYVDEPALCKTPWQPFLSSCYYVNASSPVNLFDAAQLCKDAGASLASIDSIFEERFLVDISPKDQPPFRFWALRNLTFTNWLPGQPDAAGTCQSLVVAGSYWSDGTENGGMESTACTDLRYIICEMSIDPPGEAKNQFHGIPKPGQALTDSWTCFCTDYTSSGPGCACCKSGAITCAGSGHQVCAQDSSQCPLEEFYDRSILSDGAGLRIACNNIGVSSSEPSCLFSHVPSDTWEAFPLFIGDVIAYHSVSDTLYSIGRDSKTYLEGRFNRSWSTTDWSVISAERWMTARDDGGLILHSLVPSSDYTNGDILAWNCCG